MNVMVVVNSPLFAVGLHQQREHSSHRPTWGRFCFELSSGGHHSSRLIESHHSHRRAAVRWVETVPGLSQGGTDAFISGPDWAQVRAQRHLSEMSNIAPSSVSRTRTIRPEIAQWATLPVCL